MCLRANHCEERWPAAQLLVAGRNGHWWFSVPRMKQINRAMVVIAVVCAAIAGVSVSLSVGVAVLAAVVGTTRCQSADDRPRPAGIRDYAFRDVFARRTDKRR